MKYRSRTDRRAQVLGIANDDRITKTRIMYKTFLSYTQLKEYISILVENSLLEYHQHNKTYKTTEKGNKFIQAYSQIGKYADKSR